LLTLRPSKLLKETSALDSFSVHPTALHIDCGASIGRISRCKGLT
jgi:hypothetical protein